jgi:predicted RNA-binding protein YlqC (UPF0109 family)
VADLREDFVQYVVKALVSNPDAVVLQRANDEKGDYLELTVDPVDMGKVIGKAGATAKSIRTLLRGVGAKDDLPPLPLKIVDPEGPPPAAEAEPEPGPAESAEVSDTAPEEPAPQEEAAAPAEPEPVVEEPDEHRQLHEDTKREMQELADFEV